MARLKRSFFRRDVLALGRDLLGRTLVRILPSGQRLSGVIVETEAYLGIVDKAAHTFGGRRTERNESMYLEGGHTYVYFTYGMHFCLNVVADDVDVPTACLIRAVEPLEGIELMKDHRAVKLKRERLRERDLCSGPAKLCQALGIDREFDGVDLTRSGELFLEAGEKVADECVMEATRIGVGYAKDWALRPYRFLIGDHPHVSVKP